MSDEALISPEPTGVDFKDLFLLNPRLEEFKLNLVPHRVFEMCQRDILRRVARPGGSNILSVVGPTGAGKTQLLNDVAGILLTIPEAPTQLQAAVLAAQPYLPVVFVTAATGRTFESRFKSLLIEILKQINRVLTDSNPSQTSGDAIDKRPIAILEGLVRSGLRERRVRALFIDEAQHLVKDADGTDWNLVVDGLKLLGSVSGTLVVLFGTSELLSLPLISGQIGRRCKSIHFRRYQWAEPADFEDFKLVVASFAHSLPDVLPVELLFENLAFLYAGCHGCVGTLSEWLVRYYGFR